MKRDREPFAQAGSPNSPLPAPSPAGKRGRPRNGDGDDDDAGPRSQEPPYGPFQALLAKHGVVWPSAAAMADDGNERRSLGFSCRSNPSKLRVGVERSLVHDGARRSEFVEVRELQLNFKPFFFHAQWRSLLRVQRVCNTSTAVDMLCFLTSQLSR